MASRRRREPQKLELSAALDAAGKAARRAGVTFEHRLEDISFAPCLVVSSSNPETAELRVCAVDPGLVQVDIGVGLHAEWLLRTPEEMASALSSLEMIFEAVFRGQLEERVWRRADGRHSIQGFVKAAHKTYRFRSLSVGLTAESGDRHYAPYPPITG